MIMSAIFIETFFSTCGACASADAVNASESIAMARNFPINDMFSSLSERSSWRDGYNTTVILIFHRVRWTQSIYLGNLTFVQATAVEFRYSPSTAISWPYNASGRRPRGRRTAKQRDEQQPSGWSGERYVHSRRIFAADAGAHHGRTTAGGAVAGIG